MDTDSQIRERLETETRLGAGIGDGWWPYVIAAARLLDAGYPGWESGQIKEKFAGLRFYITPAPFREPTAVEALAIENEPDSWKAKDYVHWAREWNDEQNAIARAAERACEGVCEVCGEPGEVTKTPWIHTLCPDHEAQYEQERTMRELRNNA